MQYFDQLQDVMTKSGQLVMQYFRQELQVSCKQDGSLVTNVDIENEKFLRQELAIIKPDAGFIAEESGCKDDQCDYVWVIDPLDGTRNFVKGIPHFCIILALTFHEEPIVAAIYNPITKDFYYAEKDHGAWLNRKKMMQSHIIENHGLVLVGDECKMTEIRSYIKNHQLFENMTISYRLCGSTGLDTAYVAAKSIDLIICNEKSWWDIAAGLLLIQEAGGIIHLVKNKGSRDKVKSFVAGNPLIFKQILTIVDSKICN